MAFGRRIIATPPRVKGWATRPATVGTVFRYDGASGAFEGTFYSTPFANAIAFAPVPEPSTIVLLALAALILPRSR